MKVMSGLHRVIPHIYIHCPLSTASHTNMMRLLQHLVVDLVMGEIECLIKGTGISEDIGVEEVQ